MSMTRQRLWFALIALAIGGFGIGASEFAAMGLLPEITQDLLPDLYRHSPDQALGKGSLLITAYAAGVVLGAPAVAIATNRLSHQRSLMLFAAAFTVFTAASALAPTYEFAMVARFLAALPHGAYFGLAPLVAADLMGAGKRGRGVSVVLSGLTLANLLGVPTITAFGQALNWRAAFLAIAGIFAVATVAITVVVPRDTARSRGSVGEEMQIFRRPLVWLGTLFAAVATSGFFAVYSFASPMVTELANWPLSRVAWSLAAIGLGMTIGNVLGGRLADSRPLRTLALMLPLYAIAFLGTALFAAIGPALVVLLFLLGLISSTFLPSAQLWLMDAAHGAPALGGALVHSAFNIGNAVGAAMGGAVVALGFGFRSPALAAMVTTTLAFGLLLLLFRVSRRRPDASNT
jgi:DHA1 family inner membrane transport protein